MGFFFEIIHTVYYIQISYFSTKLLMHISTS